MATERINDLRAFKGFIEAKLSNGGADLTLEDALVQWEIENQSDQEQADTLEALRRGFDDVQAGRVRPSREALQELRHKHKSFCRLG